MKEERTEHPEESVSPETDSDHLFFGKWEQHTCDSCAPYYRVTSLWWAFTSDLVFFISLWQYSRGSSVPFRGVDALSATGQNQSGLGWQTLRYTAWCLAPFLENK